MAKCTWPVGQNKICGKEALTGKIYCGKHIHGGPVLNVEEFKDDSNAFDLGWLGRMIFDLGPASDEEIIPAGT